MQLSTCLLYTSLADAPLDKVPVFIKAGAIIPVADGEVRSTEAVSYTHLYCLEKNSSVYPLEFLL